MTSLKKKEVRIAVIGDPGVGKTSLITAAALNETFPDHPVPVLPPARVPAETTLENVPLIITDTGSRPEDRHALETACLQADVIVLCFALDKESTLQRISSHWMPELSRLGITIPIMLVGCKSDIRPSDRATSNALFPILNAFRQIETCMECSARNLSFTGEVFFYALKAVLHPMAPLYDPAANELRPKCARALKMIFNLCDTDKDGLLDDAELNTFQVYCFKSPLQPSELEGVRSTVKDSMPEGILNNCLTLPGFLYLHTLFIRRGRLETTWQVLRSFGYNDELRLSNEYLNLMAASFYDPSLSLASASAAGAAWGRDPQVVVELTEAGKSFFTDVFTKFDSDGDGCLSPREYEEMMSTAPCDPWISPSSSSSGTFDNVMVETNRRGMLTLNGFLSKWIYTTTAAADPRKTLEYVYYLGWSDKMVPPTKLFHEVKSKKVERRGGGGGGSGSGAGNEGVLLQRSVVRAYLFSASSSSSSKGNSGSGGHSNKGLPAVVGNGIAATDRGVAPSASVDLSVVLEGLIAQSRAGANSGGSSSSNSIAQASVAVSPVTLSNGNTVTLVLKSFSAEQEQALLAGPSAAAPPPPPPPAAAAAAKAAKNALAACDVACFLFDARDPSSFKSSVNSMVAIATASGNTLPCLFLAQHDAEASPELIQEMGAACSTLSVKLPTPVPSSSSSSSVSASSSATTNSNANAAGEPYRTIIQTALQQPELSIPETPSLKKQQQYDRMLRRALLYTGIGTTAVLGGYIAYKVFQHHRQQGEVNNK